MREVIGHIVTGSLGNGLMMRIAPGVLSHHIRVGKFVSIVSDTYTFFSLITDVSLEVSNPHILLFPPKHHETLLMTMLHKRDMYATAIIKPMLMLDDAQRPVPVKTIPAHFSPVYQASNQDVARVFGDEETSGGAYFKIGSPLDMQTPVCLNLDRLTERSNGIFGKTGTGKTFLTRLVLAGLMHKDKAVTLIFDMHSEYGIQARTEREGQSFVKGLKTLFPDKVAIFSLDPSSTRRRGGNPDVEFVLSYHDITVEDIMTLGEELNLHTTALEAAYLIVARYNKRWLRALLDHGTQLKEFAQELGAHPESIAALYRKLKMLERLPFLVDRAEQVSVVEHMLEYAARGVSIVIEFGNYTSTFVYLLISNIIARRVHAEYVRKTELFLGSQRPEDEPKKLMIVIEEAHKFLNPQAARQTIFGIIAREMRKYYVSLLVVDQRPSGIDQEILSQIGTKIVAQLHDEKDINAVLSGMQGSSTLRSVLASLDSKKQALIMGHAVAMPVVVETREYGPAFYEAVAPQITHQHIDQLIKELF
jgi:DNA helicase HerA-like ATPase